MYHFKTYTVPEFLLPHLQIGLIPRTMLNEVEKRRMSEMLWGFPKDWQINTWEYVGNCANDITDNPCACLEIHVETEKEVVS